MRRLVTLVAVVLSAVISLGASCRPKPPTPTPTPTPTPGMPAPGVPVAPELLLRQQDAKLIGFEAVMALPCCMQFTINGAPVNSRWPMASESWQEWTAQYGVNMYHMRFGPFLASQEDEWADVGGPYQLGTLDWNPAFWNKSRELIYHALKVKARVEVVPIDTWGCKYSQQGGVYMPWPPAAINACGKQPEAEAERYIRKVVSEAGCFGNVIWSTDVEGNNIQGRQASWFLWVQSVIRDEEQRSGCGFVHMVGTNSMIPEVQGQVDYIQTHERSPLTKPLMPGHWTINNEHNPAYSPAEEVSNFVTARKAGQAWALWRAEQTDAEYAQTLQGVKDAIAGAPAGCFAPPADDPLWGVPASPTGPSQFTAQVRQAEVIVGDRKGQNGYETLGLLAAELRKMGLCASGPWADALAIGRNAHQFEELHAVAFTDGGYVSTGSQAFFKNLWPYNGTAPTPIACSEPVPPKVASWGLKPHNLYFDSTPLVHGCEYCTEVGFEGRCDCPVRGEGSQDRSVCEAVAVGGYPAWHSDGSVTVKADNPYQAKCAACTWLEVCSADSTVCQRVAV